VLGSRYFLPRAERSRSNGEGFIALAAEGVAVSAELAPGLVRLHEEERQPHQQEQPDPTVAEALSEGRESPRAPFLDLYHSQASILLNTGASIKAVSHLLGLRSVELNLGTHTHCLRDADHMLKAQTNSLSG
jgi:hypothetical protein